MSNVSFASLPAASSLITADKLLVVQSNVAKQATVGDIVAAIIGGDLGGGVSVRNYGIVGDGTDESAKWNALPANKAYFVPAGTYRLNLLRTVGLTLFGAGRGQTILTAADSSKSVIELNLPLNELVEIADMTIQGGTRGVYVHGATGAHYIHHGSYLARLTVNQQSNACLRLDTEIYNCSFRDLELSSAQYGISIVAETPLNGSVWENIWVDSTTIAAVHFENTLGATSDSGACRFGPAVIESNYGDGIYLKDCQANLEQVWFEGNGATAGYDLILDSQGNVACQANVDAYWSGSGSGQGAYRVQIRSSACVLFLTGGGVGQEVAIDLANHSPVVRCLSRAAVTIGNSLGAGVEGFCRSTFTPRPIQFAGGPNGTGISVNALDGGGTLLCLASRHTGTGNATESAVYIIRCGYSGNNFSAVYLGGTLDFMTWSQTSGQLMATIATGTCQLTFFANKMIPV